MIEYVGLDELRKHVAFSTDWKARPGKDEVVDMAEIRIRTCFVRPMGGVEPSREYVESKLLMDMAAFMRKLIRADCTMTHDTGSAIWKCETCGMYHENEREYPYAFCPRCGAKVVW